jgi:hypothetical protein
VQGDACSKASETRCRHLVRTCVQRQLLKGTAKHKAVRARIELLDLQRSAASGQSSQSAGCTTMPARARHGKRTKINGHGIVGSAGHETRTKSGSAHAQGSDRLGRSNTSNDGWASTVHSDAPLRQQAGASAVTDGAGAGLLSTVPVADGAGPADTHAASASGEDPEEQFFSLEYVLTGPYCAFFRESPPRARATHALIANQLAVLRRSHGMCTPLSPTH